MSDITALVAGNLDIWTSATQRKSGAGRGGGKRISLYGIERLRALIYDLAATGRLVSGDAVAPAKLGSHVDLVMGQAPPGNACNTNGDGTVFVKTGEFGPLYPEVCEWTTKPLKMAKSGDVLICVVGATIGKLNLAIDCAIGRSVAAIRPKRTLETTYLYYALMPFTLRLRGGARGSAQGVIGKAELNAVSVRIPPLAEQRLIVAKVDELMALCDALERESADAMAAHQALVEELLATLVNSANATDLAANWARLENHFDTLFTTDASIEALKQTILDLAVRGVLVAGLETKDKSQSTVALASREKRAMSEAEGLRARAPVARGKLARPEDAFPSHWTFTDFDSVFVTVSGVTKGQKIPPSEAIEAPYLRVANVQRGQLDLGEMKTITVKHSDFKRYQLRDGDVLMTEGGDWDKLGRAAIWRNEVPNCIHQNHVFRVRFEQNAILPEWVVLFVNSPLGREFFSRAAKQTTNLASINMTQLRSCPIPIPAYAEQHRIVAKVDALMALCDQLKTRLADASQTQRHFADAITERAAA